MTDSKDTDIRRAIENLASAQKKAMNRQLASEALLYSLLEIVPVEMLQKLEDEYDAALLRLAEQVPPSLQIPELWEDFFKSHSWSEKIPRIRIGISIRLIIISSGCCGCWLD